MGSVGENAKMPHLLRHGRRMAVCLVVALVSEIASSQTIDGFVAAALEREGMAPSSPADRVTWLRRVSLDLIGVPPTPAEVDAFLADSRDDARERQVDRLLTSPRYGERWAQWWLDLARYADSQGYEKDGLRHTMWRYRDWVIDALQRDMPFDQFTIEQIAGDLLPAATPEQHLATAFHRNTMTNTEGGTSDDEFRVAAVIDRVDTTMSVWMGATVGCAQCHDHKYDPISQREFFGIYAFFDQTADSDRDDDAPTMRFPTAEQSARLKALEIELSDLRSGLSVEDARVVAWAEEHRRAIADHRAAAIEMTPWQLLGPIAAESFHDAHSTQWAVESDGVRLDEDQDGRSWQSRSDFVDGKVHRWEGDNSAWYLHRIMRAGRSATAVLSLGSDDAIKVWWNGEEVLAKEVSRGAAPDQEILTVDVRAGDNELLLKVTNGGGPSGFYFDLRASSLGGPTEELLMTEPEGAADDVMPRLRDAFFASAVEFAELRQQIAAAEAEFADNVGPDVPVMRELAPDEQRTTRLLLAGSFLSPGEVVEPHTPACWPPLSDDAPRNRLGFAGWLVSPDNPRTAQVIANRIWSELFGRGLVETLEDFGSQGEPCSHPELLTWLGDEFVKGQWSLKQLLRTIVLSDTYGQTSVQTAEHRERDPYNIWLARGPAFRLSGETLRDQALAVSGLLSDKRGGPSVMPPQPEGVWAQIYSGAKWVEATDDDRYRRALYTFWRRLSPHPAMMVMDAQSREMCVLRRSRTNTPLQALVLWNDPQFFEAAEALAASAIEVMNGDVERLRWMWRRCLLREPTETEEARLLELLRQERATDVSEAMAWTVLASVVMNLDEFVTKR